MGSSRSPRVSARRGDTAMDHRHAPSAFPNRANSARRARDLAVEKRLSHDVAPVKISRQLDCRGSPPDGFFTKTAPDASADAPRPPRCTGLVGGHRDHVVYHHAMEDGAPPPSFAPRPRPRGFSIVARSAQLLLRAVDRAICNRMFNRASELAPVWHGYRVAISAARGGEAILIPLTRAYFTPEEYGAKIGGCKIGAGSWRWARSCITCRGQGGRHELPGAVRLRVDGVVQVGARHAHALQGARGE